MLATLRPDLQVRFPLSCTPRKHTNGLTTRLHFLFIAFLTEGVQVGLQLAHSLLFHQVEQPINTRVNRHPIA